MSKTGIIWIIVILIIIAIIISVWKGTTFEVSGPVGDVTSGSVDNFGNEEGLNLEATEGIDFDPTLQ